MPVFPVLDCLWEFAQNSCPLSGDAIQPSNPLYPPFSFCLQSFPTSGSFPVSREDRDGVFSSGGLNIGASASALGFPCGSAGKESVCNAGDLGSIPGLGRSPEEGKGYPLQYSGLENSMDCIDQGDKESDTMETVRGFMFWGSKITADGDCSHEIKRHLLLGRKTITNLDSRLKSRDVTLPTKVHLVKAMVFPVVMNGCESWTIKKAEHQRIDYFELWCWRRLLRVPWTARRSNQSILKEFSPGCSLEGLMLKLKLPYFGHLM